MTKKFIGIAVISLVAVQFCAAARHRAVRPLPQLPPAVQQTIAGKLDGGRVTGVETDRDDGALEYDVEITRNGQARDITVGADGTLIDEQVFLTELPPATQSAIQSAAGTSAVGDIYKSTDGGEADYDVEITVGGQERDYDFADDGRMLSREVFLAELAPSAQDTIRQKTAGTAIDEIDESFEDTDPDYDVQITRDGRSRDFTVSTNGTLIDEQVFTSELPAVLQTAIQKESGSAPTGDIYKSADTVATNYDVDIGEGSANRTVTFGDDGSIWAVEQTVPLTDTPEAVQGAIKTLEGKILKIDKSTEDGDVSYDVDVVAGGKVKSVNIGADGKVSTDD